MADNNQESNNYKKLKIVLLGDRAVGKSSIIQKYMTSKFEQSFNPTVGVDFMTKKVQYQNNHYKLDVWDTAGQQKFRSLVKNYLKGSDACVFIYDCTNVESYRTLIEWINIFDSLSHYNAVKIIVANKIDIRSVQNQTIAHELNQIKISHEELTFIEEMDVSAKNGHNVDALFDRIIQLSIQNRSLACIGSFKTAKNILCQDRKKIQLCCYQ